MKISKSVYEQIISLPETNIENAYLLGSTKPDIIDVLENTESVSGKGTKVSFVPNVKKWNKLIETWSKNGISFAGILHTHYYGVENLSCDDIKYIDAITMDIQDGHRKICFPVLVFPEKKLVLYLADRKSGKLTINKEKYFIREVKDNGKKNR